MDAGGRGGRGDGQHNASSAMMVTAAPSVDGTSNEQATVVSELTDRGSQNGRGFGRGAFNWHTADNVSADRNVMPVTSGERNLASAKLTKYVN